MNNRNGGQFNAIAEWHQGYGGGNGPVARSVRPHVSSAERTVPHRRRRSKGGMGTPSGISKRMVLLATAVAVVLVGSWGARLFLALGNAAHENPVVAAVQALSGGHGSHIANATGSYQRINIALYGYGGSGHDGAYLSDSIMVISIQPHPTGPPTVSEVSIPRDWFVNIPIGGGKTVAGKINEAYEIGYAGVPVASPVYSGMYGGGELADNELSQLLGIPIKYFVGVDFQAFKDAVDAVGGITVNVPDTFTDYQYPAGECAQGNCGYMTIHFNQGLQHMNGTQALEFARSRHSLDNNEGSDFARSRRQELIVEALKKQVVSLGGLGNLPDLLNAMGNNVVTNLSIGDIESLYSLVKNVHTSGVVRFDIDNRNFLYTCNYPVSCDEYALFADDKSGTWLHRFMQNLFVPASVLSAHAPVMVMDASGMGAGADTRWASILGSVGLTTSAQGALPEQANTVVLNTGGAQNSATAEWLANYFGVTVTAAKPGAGGTPLTPGVVVELGHTEELSFNNPTTAPRPIA